MDPFQPLDGVVAPLRQWFILNNRMTNHHYLTFTSLHISAMFGMTSFIDHLIHNSIVNARAANGFTPLHVVSTVEIAWKLLQAGADPLARDIDGRTPRDTATTPEVHELLHIAQRIVEIYGELVWTTRLHKYIPSPFKETVEDVYTLPILCHDMKEEIFQALSRHYITPITPTVYVPSLNLGYWYVTVAQLLTPWTPEFFKLALRISPEFGTYIQLICWYYRNKQFTEMLEYINIVSTLELTPQQTFDLKKFKAECLNGLGRIDESVALHYEIIEEEPHSLNWYKLSILLFDNKRFTEAYPAIQRAFENIDPLNLPRFTKFKAYIELWLEMVSEATNSFTTALEGFRGAGNIENVSSCLIELGNICIRQNRWHDAHGFYIEAYPLGFHKEKIREDLGRISFKIGHEYIESKQYSNAISWFQSAYEYSESFKSTYIMWYVLALRARRLEGHGYARERRVVNDALKLIIMQHGEKCEDCANAYFVLGELTIREESQAAYYSSYTIRKELLGENHPKTVLALRRFNSVHIPIYNFRRNPRTTDDDAPDPKRRRIEKNE